MKRTASRPVLFLALVLTAAFAAADIKLDIGPPPDKKEPGKGGIVVPEPTEKAPRRESTADPKGDSLVFLNGDLIHGQFVSVDGPELIWRHPEAEEPIRFRTSGIDEIRFAKVSWTPGPGRSSTLHLTNGDTLVGKIMELTRDLIVLETWYAGTMRVSRSVVQKITFGQSSRRDFVFEGPAGLNGWQKMKHAGRHIRGGAEQGVKYRSDALYLGANSGVGRMVNFPDKPEVQFEIAWRGHPNVVVYLFANKLALSNINAYMLNINGDNIYLNRYDGRRSRRAGQFRLTGMTAKGKASFNLLLDQKEKVIGLRVNGRLVQQWKDQGMMKNLGKGLAFYTYQGGIRVRDIRVAAWEGRMESVDSAAEAGERDAVLLNNNDKVSGTLLSLRLGKLILKTTYANMEIPVDRVASVQFGEKGLKDVKNAKTDARVVFANGRGITLKPEKIVEGQLVGSSENFGRVTVSLTAVKSIRMNVGVKREDGEDEDW
jgi:hypothetical protein